MSRADAANDGRSPLLCAASPCRWIGTVGITGRFFCIAHDGAEARNWTAIANRTEELTWWAQFIADVQRMIQRPEPGEQAWHGYAATFWELSRPEMAPTQLERQKPGLYVLRMLGELRAETTGKARPAPFVPQCEWPEFKPQARAGLASNTDQQWQEAA